MIYEDEEDLYEDELYGVEVRLPHDDVLDNPDKLASLSGPCITIVPAREVNKRWS